jgi:FAD/FMN-containing dehydrogenase
MDKHFLNAKSVANLKNIIDGEVLLAISRNTHERKKFVEAREIFNYGVKSQPAIIIRCKSTEDVVKSIHFIRNEKLNCSIRSGGHHACGACIKDKGVVIDVSSMNRFTFDKEQQTATLQPGCAWHTLEALTYREYELKEKNGEIYGLAPTDGECPTVLNSGYALGGGYGLTSRKFGLACDNMISAEIVLADGQVIPANDQENSDLYWALRGAGGGNFGVVTSLQFKLHPLPKQVLCGYMEWPISQAEDIMKLYRDLYLDANTPDELSFCMFLGRTPYPEGEPVINLYGLYAGPIKEGEKYVNKIKTFGRPLTDNLGVYSYLDFMTALGEEVPYGLQSKWKGGYFKNDGLSDEAIKLIVTHFEKCPSGYTLTRFDLLGGGAIARIPKDATAFVHRDSLFYISIVSLWDHDSEAEENIKWTNEYKQILSPYLNGHVYQNYADDELTDWADAYYGQNYTRLQQIKRTYDPENLFEFQQSIRLPD